MTILALWTSNVVAPIPGLSSLPSLSDIFSAGVDEPTTEDPSLSESSGKNLSAGAAAAGSFAFDKGIHLGNPKLGSLDANLDLAASGSKSIGISKGETKGVTADPRIIIFDIPTSTLAPPVSYYPPVQYAPPPPHYAPAPSYHQPPHYEQPQRYEPQPSYGGPVHFQQKPQHYNVHNGNNRPQY